MLSRRLNNCQEVFKRLGFKLGIQSEGIYFPSYVNSTTETCTEFLNPSQMLKMLSQFCVSGEEKRFQENICSLGIKQQREKLMSYESVTSL